MVPAQPELAALQHRSARYGHKWQTSKVRWAALVLMVGTAFKIFFMELWRLGQLYRVASFVGLAAVLILVSFLYQRVMTGKDAEEKQENEDL